MAQTLVTQTYRELSFNMLETFSDDVAIAFSTHQGLLSLEGIKHLPGKAKELLEGLGKISNPNIRGVWEVESDKCIELSPEDAQLLISRHIDTKVPLQLEGLITLSPETAQVIINFTGEIILGGLTSLSPETAAVLKESIGSLSFASLETLSLAAALAIAKHKGPSLKLNGLLTLPPEVAGALGDHEGELNLDGIHSLTDKVAAGFAKHKGGLSFGGLTSMSDTTAEALSHHIGMLDLASIRTLSDKATKSLSKHEGWLYLRGLDLSTLSESAIELLRNNTDISMPDA